MLSMRLSRVCLWWLAGLECPKMHMRATGLSEALQVWWWWVHGCRHDAEVRERDVTCLPLTQERCQPIRSYCPCQATAHSQAS